MATKVYTYKNCSTCKKATQWLKAQSIDFDEIPIRETPPSEAEIRLMHGQLGELKKLFNTSGMDYRNLNIKESLPGMSDGEAYQLLAGNGNLIKRPFLLSDKRGIVGFKEAAWVEFFEG